jgi:putative protease
MNKLANDVEIMAPAGSWESMNAAIKAGANSVYFGVEKLNMRARAANNFKSSELKKITNLCKKNNVKSYLTLNIVLYDDEIKEMKSLCDKAKKAGVSAVIASDVSAIQYANSIGLEVHISTQANVSNLEAVKFYSKYADVIVLARELTIDKIKNIIDEIKKQNIKGPSGKLIRIELFVHGAMCVSISGKCYMSLALFNHSANRGDCSQPCRRKYNVKDDVGNELEIDNQFVMSPKDMCTINFIDKLLDAGAKVLKIEGRGRSADYVYSVVKAYREAVDLYKIGKYTKEEQKRLLERLEAVFNRGFWHGGYYLGKKLGEWSGNAGSSTTKTKLFLGPVHNYYPKAKIFSVSIETNEINIGDELIITGPTTGVVELNALKLVFNDKEIKSAGKGKLVTIPCKEKVRKNDKVYVLKKNN